MTRTKRSATLSTRMKFYIESPDANNFVDHTISNLLLRHFDVTTNLAEADVVIMPVSFCQNFVFKSNLKIARPYIIIDFLEYGHAWDRESSHLIGTGRRMANLNDEYMLLDAFVAHRPPLVYFKRELLQKDVTKTVKPIEWPCYIPSRPIATKQAFDSRAVDVFYSWGFSNCQRPNLHAEIFRQMCIKPGIGIISSWDHMGYFGDSRQRNTWATIYSPHYARKPINTIIDWQMMSKITVSMPGNGVKCFRSTEGVGCITALQDDLIAWSHPWIHGENCIRMRIGDEVESLYEATHRPDLYEIYLRSQETINMYQAKNYMDRYIMPSIQEVL